MLIVNGVQHGIPSTAKGFTFGWSQTRAKCFEECDRKYYLHYYAASVDEEIKRLRDLSAMQLWTGTIVHDAIETFLKTSDGRMPSPQEQRRLIERTVQGQMAQDWQFSLAKTKKFRLMEHEYDVPVTPWEKRVAVGIVTRCLENFFQSTILADAFKVGKSCWLSVEELCEMDVSGVLVRIKMDFAYVSEDRVKIVDWKTGSPNGDNDDQVAGYALYAFSKGWGDTDNIDTCLAYLQAPKYDWKTVDAGVLAKARQKIKNSAESMKARLVDPEGNVADVRDFHKRNGPDDWACRRCQFRRVCW